MKKSYSKVSIKSYIVTMHSRVPEFIACEQAPSKVGKNSASKADSLQTALGSSVALDYCTLGYLTLNPTGTLFADYRI